MIYTDAPVYTAHLGVTDPPLVFPLNWTPAHVQVDNYTSQYLYLPDAEVTVGPGVVGRIVPLRGTTQARAVFQTPPGLVTPLLVPGQIADLVFMSAGVAASPAPGVLLNPGALPTTQNQIQLGRLDVAASTSASQSWDVAPAYYAIAISLAGSGVTVLQVVGRQTGVTYYSINPSNVPSSPGYTPGFYVVPVNTAWDTRYRIDVTTGSGGAATAYVAAIQNPEAMFTLAATGNQQVTLERANAAPWQAPDTTAEGQANLLANGVFTIAPGAVNQRIYVHAASLYTPDAGGAFGALRYVPALVGSTVEIGRGVSGAQGQVFQHDYKGKPLPSNHDLQVLNPGGTAVNLWWTVEYTRV